MEHNLKCFKCHRAQGDKPRDNGAHTAQVIKCSECGEIRPCLPDRHWIKE